MKYKYLQRFSLLLPITFIGLLVLTATFAGCRDKEIMTPYIPIVRDTFPPNDTIPMNSDTTDTIKPDSSYSYMALGDSYTIGQSVAVEARFPMQVAAMLQLKNIAIRTPDIIATTGWTTQNLLSAITTQNPRKDYDVVSLLIGVNNQYQQRDTVGYRDQFTLCLNKAIELAAGRRNHVFVLSIPDYSVTPFGGGQASIATQIDQYNAINKEITGAYGISYTDVTPASRQAASDPTLIASDGLHPSGSQYALWAKLLAPKIEALLR